MFLQELVLKEAANLTQEIANQSSEAAKQLFSELMKKFLPLIEIIGGIVALYIIYRIITGISNHLLKKRVKRIDKNVLELQGKLDEIIKILKKPKEDKEKKTEKLKK